jgi:hypothetical protein
MINSDIEYIDKLAYSIIQDFKNNSPDEGKIMVYRQTITHLNTECLKADKMTLKLLALCRLALNVDERMIREKFFNLGGLIDYSINTEQLGIEIKEIEKKETISSVTKEKAQFIALYFDATKTRI